MNNEKVYEFNSCNDIGRNGEMLMAELFPNTFEITDGMNGDLIFKTKYKFELKTDTYKSGNFFFERISNIRLNNNGGVWQTKEHGCQYYAFYMLKYDKLYIFEVDTILKWLDENIYKYQEKIVTNPTKKSMGYAVPIKDVENLCIKVIDLTEVIEYPKLKSKYNFEYSTKA
jgi:hypothetical protein